MQAHLNLFAPPYTALSALDLSWTPTTAPFGEAILWQPTGHGVSIGEFEFVESRPRGYTLIIILPPPALIGEIAALLPRLGVLRPHAVLPGYGRLEQLDVIRSAFAMPPRSIPDAVSWYLDRYGVVTDPIIRKEVRRIFELAPKTPSIAKLSRDMYTSRRTLGRHFDAHRLPVPSHWLQFARVLNVLLRSHSEKVALFRLATSLGYPDGFTMSNQMKRLIGYRPSEVRGVFGLEWVLEAWLRQERIRVC